VSNITFKNSVAMHIEINTAIYYNMHVTKLIF